jgi:hypothetical protein
MAVANGGMLYVLGTDDNWYLLVNGGWMRTSSPDAGSEALHTFEHPLA